MSAPPAPRIAFVTNLCPHYRVKTFETLAAYHNVEYLFYSGGQEWYWQKSHGVRVGNFAYSYLSGVEIGRHMRIVPSLSKKLCEAPFDLYIKCINGRFALPVTYLIARMRRKPFILWTGIWMSLQTPFHRLVFPLTRWIYRHSDAIVVYGEHVRRYLMGIGVDGSKIFVAPHAIDNPQYSRPVAYKERTELKQSLDLNEKKVILYLGRIEKEKGLEYLARAFTELKSSDTAIVFAGDGALRSDVEAILSQSDLRKNVRWVGYVPPEQAVVYYAIADLFVLPSVTVPTGKEPWGLVINEAMNQGVPVVVTDAVGAAAGGLVQHGVNGLIVPEANSAAIAEAIDRVLRHEGLRQKMSQNARDLVTIWNNERMVEGFRNAIDYVLEKRHRA